MKNSKLRLNIALTVTLAALFSLFLFSFVDHQSEPWTSDQLMEPGDLASTINDPERPQPFVISVGPGAVIKGSLEIGPTVDKVNIDKLQAHLDTLQKDASIVIYCGCCPFNKCPNIRPAFSLLNKMAFENHKLLNLPRNVKSDWIDRGYPVNE